MAGYYKDYIRPGSGVYPIVRSEPGGVVEGRLLQVTPAELQLIDRYEGATYRRVRVRLVSGREAWVYTGL
ncbi:MAG: gamma-glutamylcyclotransferase family protein [Anaerolineae bacterium]